jgi:restriction system protein
MSSKFMYEIEVRHRGLNKYRHIKGSDKYIVEQKAHMQQLAWDEMWEKKLLAEEKRVEKEEKIRSREENKELALSRTAEAQNEISEIKNILNHTLRVNDAINWEKLLDRSAFKIKKPSEPRVIEYTGEPVISDPEFIPNISFFDKIFKKRKQLKLEKSIIEFQIAHSLWLEKCAEIDSQNVKNLERYNISKETWLSEKTVFEDNQKNHNEKITIKQQQYLNKEQNAIVDYCEMVLSNSSYPDILDHDFDIEYNEETKTLIIDFNLPDKEKLPTLKEIKYLVTKNEFSESFISEKELNSLYDELIYQITLRTHHEIYESDVVSAIDSVVFNGWVSFIDKANGQLTTSCIISLQTSKDEFLAINLSNVDPKACFKQLRGIGSRKLHSISPIAPILTISKEDRRFIDAYSVAHDIDDTSNLAAMDWQDFENLIREIFEKEFSTSGGEVKITQASRDGGVDAVAFDPDPIRGGKIVIQAKRYTNVVGVSAVRDLYGTTMNEGATKGILVTTADFGPDAYEFAKGKPLTLLNGGNLLHLLAKHGHKAKIDLKEAKKILSAS